MHTIAALERTLAGVRWPDDGDTVVDGSGIATLDTSGAWLLHRTMAQRVARGGAVRLQGFRPEFTALLQLLATRDIPLQAPRPQVRPWLERVGRHAWTAVEGLRGYLAFAGTSTLALLAALRNPRRLRWRPILHNIQIAGFDALPIVGLLSFLLGIVVAYQGADQLQATAPTSSLPISSGCRCCASSRP